VAESAGDLSIPLSWCYVALRQAERVRESYAEWRAVKAVGEESDQLDFLYWGDAHYLISAMHQMSKALDRLPSGPKLPKRLKNQIRLIRHTLERWNDDDEGGGGWKTLVLKHPPGSDLISLDELEQVLIRVRDELLEVYPAKPELPEVYHGMPQLIEADARGRAVLRAWQEMLELHNGRWELIDRELFRARVRELLELYREAPVDSARSLHGVRGVPPESASD
jgi:hypothetical protein